MVRTKGKIKRSFPPFNWQTEWKCGTRGSLPHRKGADRGPLLNIHFDLAFCFHDRFVQATGLPRQARDAHKITFSRSLQRCSTHAPEFLFPIMHNERVNAVRFHNNGYFPFFFLMVEDYFFWEIRLSGLVLSICSGVHLRGDASQTNRQGFGVCS
jgi:hypothetical protein